MELLDRIGKRLLHLNRNPARDPQPRVRRPRHPLLSLGIDLLLDVGANTGQYAMQARRNGYAGAIVSFEPLPDAHAALVRNAADDPGWTVHERCALGAAPGMVEIHVSENSQSSSILPILDTHLQAAPASRTVGTCQTPLQTLDTVFPGHGRGDLRTYLKIDTQGFESEVLKGAEHALGRIIAVEVELSTTQLYQDQPTYPYFLDFFTGRDFGLWSLSPGFFNKRSGRMLQFDAVFVRNDVIAST